MTKFKKENFNYHGGYLTYAGKFVARFKYSGTPIKMGMFKRELMKNHTVESYFSAIEAGETPVHILKNKNISWYVQAMNKHYGYDVVDSNGNLIKGEF